MIRAAVEPNSLTRAARRSAAIGAPAGRAIAQTSAAAPRSWSFVGAVIKTGFLFSFIQIGFSLLLSQMLLPIFVNGVPLSGLEELANRITSLIYGSTALAAGLAALAVAGPARRSSAGFLAVLVAEGVGVAAGFAVAIGFARVNAQVTLDDTIVTHAFVAGVAVVAITLASRIGRGRGRLLNRGPRFAVALSVLLVVGLLAPAGTMAAKPNPAYPDIPSAECALSDAEVSSDATASISLIGVGSGFDYHVSRNADGSWDVEAAVSWLAGLHLQAGEKVDIPATDILNLKKVLTPAKLLAPFASLNSDSRVKVSLGIHTSDSDQMRSFVVGSLASYSWHEEAFPGLGSLLPDRPVTASETNPTVAGSVTLEVGGKTEAEFGIGPLSFKGSLAPGLRVKGHVDRVFLDHPFSLRDITGDAELGLSLGVDAQEGVDLFSAQSHGEQKGSVYVYMGLELAASDHWELSGTLNARVEGGFSADLGVGLSATAILGKLAKPVGKLGFDASASVKTGGSATFVATIDDNPENLLALFSLARYTMSVVAGPPVDSALGPVLSALSDLNADLNTRWEQVVRTPTTAEAQEAFLRLVENSRGTLVVRHDASVNSTVAVQLGLLEISAGFENNENRTLSALAQAFYKNSAATFANSATCVAGVTP